MAPSDWASSQAPAARSGQQLQQLGHHHGPARRRRRRFGHGPFPFAAMALILLLVTVSVSSTTTTVAPPIIPLVRRPRGWREEQQPSGGGKRREDKGQESTTAATLTRFDPATFAFFATLEVPAAAAAAAAPGDDAGWVQVSERVYLCLRAEASQPYRSPPPPPQNNKAHEHTHTPSPHRPSTCWSTRGRATSSSRPPSAAQTAAPPTRGCLCCSDWTWRRPAPRW